jgi:hypothetical protein
MYFPSQAAVHHKKFQDHKELAQTKRPGNTNLPDTQFDSQATTQLDNKIQLSTDQTRPGHQ